MSRYPAGTRVRIVKDCRDGAPAEGQDATCLGRFWLLSEKRYRGPRAHWEANPRFLLDDGSTIWGIECWWCPLSEIARFAPQGERAPEPAP